MSTQPFDLMTQMAAIPLVSVGELEALFMEPADQT